MRKVIITVVFLLTTILNYSQPGKFIEQASGVDVELTSVYAPNQSTAWICGYSGTVLRTTNGGINWLNVSGNGIPATRSLVNIFGRNSDNALTAGYEGENTYVYRTTNAGRNWTQVFSETGFINSVWMISGTNGFMMGDPSGNRWSMWKTTNGGANWDSTGLFLPKSGTEKGWNNSMLVFPNFDKSKIWFGTNNSRIYYSSNYGASWSVQQTPELNTYAVFFPPYIRLDGLAAGTNVIRTTSSGRIWNKVKSSGSGTFSGITGHNFTTDNLILMSVFYVRNSNTIYFSSNNGLNWVSAYTASEGNYRHISTITPFNLTSIWAVRDNGGITKISYTAGSETPVSTEIPNLFSPSQKHANPFNSATTFKFSQTTKSFVKVKVYNSIGAEIETLVDMKLPPSVYKATWDASRYPSGVYYYRITTSTQTETRKIVLIK